MAALVVVSLFLAGAAAAGQGEDSLPQENWMAIYLAGQKIGYSHTRITGEQRDGKHVVVTTSRQQISLARAGSPMQMGVYQEVVEDPDGALVSFVFRMEQGFARMETRGVVRDGRLSVTTEGLDGPTSLEVAAPEGLCPWAADRVVRATGLEPGTELTLSVFNPQAPTRTLEVNLRVGGTEQVQVFEVHKWLHRVDWEVPALHSLSMTQWVDEEGRVWLERAGAAGFRMEMRRTTRQIATAPAEPAEVMVNTSIRPDRAIPDPRGLDSLRVRISPKEDAAGESRLVLPSDRWQGVEPQDGALVVELRKAVADPAASYELPYRGEEYAELLKSTPWLEVDDELIRRMSREAVGGEADALRAARRVEAYVMEAIESKNLNTGFATALETARQRAGDCTEHALLAAALARAAGIPSRIVTGLAYGTLDDVQPNGRFYYHMWTEVYVGGWYPIDAALGGHDATHLAISRSALDRPGDMLDISAALLQFLGNVRIEVLRIGPAAQTQ